MAFVHFVDLPDVAEPPLHKAAADLARPHFVHVCQLTCLQVEATIGVQPVSEVSVTVRAAVALFDVPGIVGGELQALRTAVSVIAHRTLRDSLKKNEIKIITNLKSCRNGNARQTTKNV